MKLVRMNDAKIGLLVLLAEGPHVIDIANSLGVFAPHDPLSNGLLNGAFKDGGDWSLIVKHWAHLRPPLKRLAGIATAVPDHPNLVLRPFAEQLQVGDAADPIVAIDITGTECLEEHDPTGRRAMERQFMALPDVATRPDTPSSREGAQVIDFLRR